MKTLLNGSNVLHNLLPLPTPKIRRKNPVGKTERALLRAETRLYRRRHIVCFLSWCIVSSWWSSPSRPRASSPFFRFFVVVAIVLMCLFWVYWVVCTSFSLSLILKRPGHCLTLSSRQIRHTGGNQCTRTLDFTFSTVCLRSSFLFLTLVQSFRVRWVRSILPALFDVLSIVVVKKKKKKKKREFSCK